MLHVRRTEYLFFRLGDGSLVDISLLLRGEVSATPTTDLFALSILKGIEYPIAMDDLQMLFAIPSAGWIPVSELANRIQPNSDQLSEMAHKGLILTDENDERLLELRRRDELLSSTKWYPLSALYHFMSKWRDVDIQVKWPNNPDELGDARTKDPKAIEAWVQARGEPPSHFHTITDSLAEYELPLIKKKTPLYDILSKRKTTRVFDTHTPMTVEDLSTVLYYVYGCHGYAPVTDTIVGVKKTSPSGGGLHPTEVYPLIMNVDGIAPGVYHYNVGNHSLEMMVALTQPEATDWANEFTAGQVYPRWAHVLFIMTSRFYRNHWKYQLHPKTYAVLFMDAAHLSQTFYLVCTELGLGAFVTGAINAENIEERLKLDGFEEGVLALCGCGKPAEIDNFDPTFYPYIPRTTRI